ncbi:MAG TPA: ChaN family lipoprotein [Casimicrobiaceae bacterium]|nr:ChaN family lipoprotein [Casimicrobiaceae bacterium]
MVRLPALLSAVLALHALPSTGAAPAAEPRIWDVRAGRFVSESSLAADLASARYRLLGEVHDNAAHHAIRARLILAIAATGARPALVMEQFDLDRDEALIAAQAAGANAERLADAGRLDRKGWQWPMHKPIVEAALAQHLPIRAGNLSRAQLREEEQSIVDDGAKAIGYARFHAARWTDAQAEALRADIVESHCGMAPESVVPRIVLAQRLRDAAMAQALADAATASGAILIAGNGHVRSDLGVPVYLHAPGLPDAGAPSLSVGLIEVDDDDARARDFPRQVVAAHPGFDYLWFTPPAAREDPCANFRMPAR